MGAGVLYVRPNRLDSLRPASVGWGSVVNPFAWEEIDYTLRPSTQRYEIGSPAFASVIAVGTGLSMLQSLGSDHVSRRVIDLGDRFAAGVSEVGCTVVSPRTQDGEKSGAVCFVPPGDAEAAKSLYETLAKEHETELASRCGRVRFSPHFYNTHEQVDRVVRQIASVVG